MDFLPVAHLKSLYDDPVLVEKLNETIFKSPDWLVMDHGMMSRNDTIQIFCEREPDLKPEIIHVMQSVDSMFTPKPDSISLLPEIKAAGHKLYYLSNMQNEIRDYLLVNHDYLKLFDGGVFSCDVKYIKPAPEIYRILINKYDLIPEECLFFDDMPENVAAAEKEGIKSVLFTTADQIKDYL